MEGLTITRHKDGDEGEYHAHIEGTEAIGRLTWVTRSQNGHTARVAEHTLVPREIGGRGVASALVDALVADAREHGFKIVPQCSYVAKKFGQNPTWADLRV
ncbi:GNAT family N-acetyltransferase [Pontixanthobacter aestiaquae]|uniref:N-acetyltransferase n=1 Tax=Pontixanthobacter aestiaquae TaxID=1509367 RepID=A0A844Z3U1_9SPHN|nr:GNAT family N-acetyltransferase [Pontixanthobacter aestiaquae]MDN3647010.1 GNAT family N-acetyltransferase [Pontixanthobacter aestiaquae]MXO82012.1 N-acetyltransferase [Pontixanthobacter aestiaquae]